MNREELRENLARMTELFCGRFGYEHVPLGDSLIADELTTALRGFSTHRDRRKSDYIAVYLTGHGDLRGEREHVLLTRDSRPDDLHGKALPTADIGRLMLAETSVRRLLLILDTCYSGQGGAELAAQALKWSTWPEAEPGDGVVVVAASQPRELAKPEAFTTAFVKAAESEASAGLGLPATPVTAVVNVVRGDPDVPETQRAGCQLAWLQGLEPEFLPNRFYRGPFEGLDLWEQGQLRAPTGQRQHEVPDQILPRIEGFVGRDRALSELAAWLNLSSDAVDPLPRIVTGQAGSGKSAVLGLLAALADPDRRPAVPVAARSTVLPSEGVIDEVIYAEGLKTYEVLARIAAAAGVHADTAKDLLARLTSRAVRPLTVLIDALDEAADPEHLVTDLLRPLAEHAPGQLRLLLGTRDHLMRADLLGPRDGTAYVEIDLDSAEFADPSALGAHVRSILLSGQPGQGATQTPPVFLDTSNDIVDAATEAIKQAAGTSFLVARIVAITQAASTQLPNPYDPLWVQDLPGLAGEAMEKDLRQRLGDQAGLAEALLLPLAYAKGSGLPHEDIWPKLAAALSPEAKCTPEHLIWLRRVAGSYIVETSEAGYSAYRLYHQSMVEYLCIGRNRQADERVITEALSSHVDRQAGGRPDWPRAHPYIQAHLATHSAAGEMLGALLHDGEYLLAADRRILLAALDTLYDSPDTDTRAAVHAYWQADPYLCSCSELERRSYLGLAAHMVGATQLGASLAAANPHGAPPPRWLAKWASWRQETPHRKLTGHSNLVRGVAAVPLPGGRTLLASGSDDGTVRLWDPATGDPAGDPLTGHSGVRLKALAVAASQTMRARLASFAGARAARRPNAVALLSGGVNAVAAVPLPGRRTLLASGGDDGTVRLWNPATGDPVGDPLTGHSGGVNAVAAVPLPGGRTLLASGGDDGTVRLWDPATGDPVGDPLTGHTGGVRAVAALPGGRMLLASGGGDGTVRLWDPATGDPVGDPLTGHTGGVNAVAAVPLPGGRTLLASGGDDGTVRLWDPATGDLAENADTGHAGGRVNAVAAVALPGGRMLLASGGDDGTVRLWDPATGDPVGHPLTGHTGGVNAVAAVALPGGRTLLASGGDDGTVRLWDPATGDLAENADTGHAGGRVNAVAAVALPGGRMLLASGGDDGTVRLWDSATGDPVGHPLTGHTGGVRAVAAVPLPGGRTLLASGGDDGTVRLWDPATGDTVGDPLTGHTDWVRALAAVALPGGRMLLASGGDDGTVRLWDSATGDPVGHPLTGHTGGVRAVAAVPLPGGRTLLASGGGDGTVRLWDPATGDPVGTPLTGHTSWVRALAAVALPGGRTMLASGGGDGEVRLWDPDAHHANRGSRWLRSVNREQVQPVSIRRMPGAIQDVQATDARCLIGAETALIIWDTLADDIIIIEMGPDVEAVTAQLPYTIVVATQSGIVVFDVPTIAPAPLVLVGA